MFVVLYVVLVHILHCLTILSVLIKGIFLATVVSFFSSSDPKYIERTDKLPGMQAVSFFDHKCVYDSVIKLITIKMLFFKYESLSRIDHKCEHC